MSRVARDIQIRDLSGIVDVGSTCVRSSERAVRDRFNATVFLPAVFANDVRNRIAWRLGALPQLDDAIRRALGGSSSGVPRSCTLLASRVDCRGHGAHGTRARHANLPVM